jgi:hypothetical protein
MVGLELHPSKLVTALILQTHDKVSDEEAKRRAILFFGRAAEDDL